MIITKTPDSNSEPYRTLIPFVWPINIIGATAVKVQPNTIGKPVPVPFHTCNNVAIPHIKISTVTKNAICSDEKCKLVPTIIGTSIAPAYIASKC